MNVFSLSSFPRPSFSFFQIGEEIGEVVNVVHLMSSKIEQVFKASITFILTDFFSCKRLKDSMTVDDEPVFTWVPLLWLSIDYSLDGRLFKNEELKAWVHYESFLQVSFVSLLLQDFFFLFTSLSWKRAVILQSSWHSLFCSPVLNYRLLRLLLFFEINESFF